LNSQSITLDKIEADSPKGGSVHAIIVNRLAYRVGLLFDVCRPACEFGCQ
jgi:hypothetical protein